jgi:hypothetical protein
MRRLIVIGLAAFAAAAAMLAARESDGVDDDRMWIVVFRSGPPDPPTRGRD